MKARGRLQPSPNFYALSTDATDALGAVAERGSRRACSISTCNSCRLREIAFRPFHRITTRVSRSSGPFHTVRNNTNMASPDKSPSKWSKASGSPVGNAMKMMSALKAAGAKLDVVDHDGPIGDDQHAAARANSEAHRVLSKREAERARTNAFHAQLAHVRNVQQSALRGGVHQTEKLQARLRCTRRSKELIAADKAEQEELAAAAAAAAAAEVEPTGA